MNDIEKRELINLFGSTDNNTMGDYFELLSDIIGVDSDTLKTEFKKLYSSQTDWSF